METAYKIAEPGRMLPGAALPVFHLVHRVHRIWWWFNRGRIYSDPSNTLRLTAGYTLSRLLDDNIFYEWTTKAVLIASKTAIFSRQARTVHAYYKTLIGKDQCYPVFEARYFKSTTFLSPSDEHAIRESFYKTVQRVQEIAVSLICFLSAIAIFSMCFLDLIDAIQFSATSKKERGCELFVNFGIFTDTLLQDRKLLLASIDDHAESIDQVLLSCGSTLRSQDLSDHLRRTLAAAEFAQIAAKAADLYVTRLLGDLSKRALSFSLSAMKVSWLCPKWLVPDETPFYRLPSLVPAKKSWPKPLLKSPKSIKS